MNGAADFIAIVSAVSLDEYDGLMDRMMTDNPNIRRYTTSVVLQAFKQDTLIPA